MENISFRSKSQKLFNLIKSLFNKINNETEYFAVGNHTCCNTCGHYEIFDALQNSKCIKEKKAYVFYHMQETDSIKETIKENSDIINIHLAFGAFESIDVNDDNELQICKDMYESINKISDSFPIKFVWDGTLEKKIIIEIDLNKLYEDKSENKNNDKNNNNILLDKNDQVDI
jgi:hypothetical protein